MERGTIVIKIDYPYGYFTIYPTKQVHVIFENSSVPSVIDNKQRYSKYIFCNNFIDALGVVPIKISEIKHLKTDNHVTVYTPRTTSYVKEQNKKCLDYREIMKHVDRTTIEASYYNYIFEDFQTKEVVYATLKKNNNNSYYFTYDSNKLTKGEFIEITKNIFYNP